MAQQVFTVEFTFAPINYSATRVDTRRTTVRAHNAIEAANSAWRSRGSLWGAFGTDNATDCYVVQGSN